MARKEISPLQALEDELTHALASDSGISPAAARLMVTPIVRHLCSEYGGEKIYIPTTARNHRIDEIKNYFAVCKDVEKVCSKYSISRRTLYRLLDQAA